MPKRDARYMEEQREMTARAALRCILEKGLAATTTRAVCAYAGISKGALYTHYRTREDLIIAVLELEAFLNLDPVDNWADYEKRILSLIDPIAADETLRLLMSASYEFLSEIIRANLSLPKLDAEWDANYHFYRESLRVMHERGEISLPLGLDPTMRLHIQIQAGAIYCLLADRRHDHAQMRIDLLQSLSHAAGLKRPAPRVSEPAVIQRNALSGGAVTLTFPYGEGTASGYSIRRSRPSKATEMLE